MTTIAATIAQATAQPATAAGHLADLLTEAGAVPGAAVQIAAQAARGYLAGTPAVADDLADLTAQQRGIAMEFAVDLVALAHAAGQASCPDLAPAVDHAAAALRLALAHGPR